MKLTVLVDNNTFIDEYLIGEPAVSYFIECDGRKIIFDLGYSDVFLKNAQILQIDLADIDDIVLSHGHNDHTWGLNHLTQYYDRTVNPPKKRINIIAHPDALLPKYYEKKSIGINFKLDENSYFFKKNLTREPVYISENILFLGQIPRINPFEAKNPVGHTHDITGELIEDYVYDDSALTIKTEQGLVIITGCSHAGICNIIEYAKRVTGESRVASVIGGFHLLNASDDVLSSTGEYLNELSAGTLYPCHCTDLAAKIYLSGHVKIAEVGVGLTLEFNSL